MFPILFVHSHCLVGLGVSCFSHTLQLAVEDAVKIPAVSKALARIRRLVTHFNHSPKATYVLKQKQQLLQHTDLTLILVLFQVSVLELK